MIQNAKQVWYTDMYDHENGYKTSRQGGKKIMWQSKNAHSLG